MEEEDEEEEEEENHIIENKKKTKSKKNKSPKCVDSTDNIYSQIEGFKKEISKKYKGEKDVLKSFEQFASKIKKQKKKFDKKRKGKNLKKYLDLISNKNLISDIKFFKTTMSCEEQEKVLLELEEIKSMTTIDKPYRIQLLENKDIPSV